MYKIVNNIPLPINNRGRFCKYPFYDMEAGTSFECPVREGKSVRCAVAYYIKHNKGSKFVTRVNKDKTLITIWCIVNSKNK
jgi:hypothetical protein